MVEELLFDLIIGVKWLCLRYEIITRMIMLQTFKNKQKS